MFIVDKKGKQVANTEHMVFFGIGGKKIALMTEKGVELTLGEYETPQEAAEMFVALCNAIEQGKHLFRMYKTGNEVEDGRERKKQG